MRRVCSAVLLAIVVCFTSSCKLLVPHKPFSVIGLEHASTEELTSVEQQLGDQADEITTFRMLLNVTIQEQGLRDHVKQILVFRKPYNLRFEFFERSINQSLLLLTTTRNQLKAYDYRDKTAYVGVPSRKNFLSLLSVPLTSEEIMLLFTGRFKPPPMTEGGRAIMREMFVDSGDNSGILQYEFSDGLIMSLRLENAIGSYPLRVDALEVLIPAVDGEQQRFQADFNYNDEIANPFDIPSELTLKIESRQVAIRALVEQFTVNPKLKNEARLFDVRFPRKAKTYLLK